MYVIVKGTRYASEDGQFIQARSGAWYSLQTDFKWRPYKMPPRVLNRLVVVAEFESVPVWRRG